MDKRYKIPMVIGAILLSVLIVAGILSISTLLKIATPDQIYGFIKNNFNPNILNTSLTPQVITINSTITVANYTTIQFANGTYIYYFGAKFCPFCASLSYPLYSALHNKTLPNYSSNFYTAENNIPAIPMSLMRANISISGVNATYLYENPLTATDLQAYPSAEISNKTTAWEQSLPSTALYLFAMQPSFPNIYVVHTAGAKTEVCKAYTGIELYQYNSTDMTQLRSVFNMQGVSLKSIIPDTNNMEQQQSLIYNCISKLNQ